MRDDYNSCKVLQIFNNDVINVLNDFITEDSSRGTFDFRNDLYKPCLQALIESIDPKVSVHGCFEIIWYIRPNEF